MDGDRERGKAGPGHRRRTDKQIAEDTAYFASLPASAPLAPGADAPLISTGEERISPEDAADEAAETAARATDKPTLETLRAAVGRYTETFGAKASIENIRAIIGKPMIEVAEEELPAAIARVEAANSRRNDHRDDADRNGAGSNRSSATRSPTSRPSRSTPPRPT